MADPAFVEGKVREMLHDCRRWLTGAPRGLTQPSPPELLVRKWAEFFSADNAAVVQRMTPEEQAAWLRKQDLALRENDAVMALVSNTLRRFVTADLKYAQGDIDEEQHQFWLDTAIEDCTCWAMGIENPAN